MKRSFRSIFCCLLAALTVLALLAGCGAPQAASGTTAAPAQSTQAAVTAEPQKQDITLTFAASEDWIKDIDKTLADQFAQETGIKIDFQMNPNDQYTNIVKAKLLSGEGPDIFMCNGAIGMNEYLPDKYFSDLSDQPWVSKMKDWAKSATNYKGKTVGLDIWSVDGWGILYNNKIYEKLGLSIPKTFEDFCKVNDAILKSGVTPIYESGKDAWHQCIWLLEIGDYVNKKYPGLYDKLNTAEGKFADIPEALTLTQQLKTIVDKGYFGKDYMSQTWDKAVDSMASGKFASILVYSAFTNEVMAKYPDSGADQWLMYPLPMAGNNSFSTSGGGEIMVLNRQSKNPDAVKQYFSFLTQPENLQKYYDNKPQLVVASFDSVQMKESAAWKSVVENSPGGLGIDFSAGCPYYNADNIGKVYQELYIGAKKPEQVLVKIDSDRAAMFKATSSD